MLHNPVLKSGNWTEASFPVSSFKAVCPLTGKQLTESFPVSSFLDLDEMLQFQVDMRDQIEGFSDSQRARLLQKIAEKIESAEQELINTANEETGLEKDTYLDGKELRSTIAYLRLAAQYCDKDTWADYKLDASKNIVSFRQPMPGPIVIFGPSSSPFLYSASVGVSFAAAIAAGNSIIAKGNPAHPATGMKLARLVFAAIEELQLPRALFQYFHHTTPDLGYRLAAHPLIGALAFNGRFRSGLLLKENAERSGNPVYLDLNSVSPALLLPQFVEAKREKLAKDICAQIFENSGQNPDRPGPFFIVEDRHSSPMIKQISDAFGRETPKPMLSDVKARHLDNLVSDFIRLGARKLTKKESYSPTPFSYPYTAMVTDLKNYLKFSRQFQEYASGPLALFVTLDSPEQFSQVVKSLESSSNCSIFSESGEIETVKAFLPILRRKCASLLFNRWVQNEALSPAIIRSGAFPASGNPTFSHYGLPEAIKKFTALSCLQGFPDSLR
jgi:NADP-dependent aldehyde dehydrogenase